MIHSTNLHFTYLFAYLVTYLLTVHVQAILCRATAHYNNSLLTSEMYAEAERSVLLPWADDMKRGVN